MKRIIGLIIIFLITASAFSIMKIDIIITENPPFISADTDGYGIICDIIKEAYRTQNIEVNFIVMPEEKAGNEFLTAKYPASIYVDYSNFYNHAEIKASAVFYTRLVFFYMKTVQKMNWEKQTDLVGLIIGTINEPYMTKITKQLKKNGSIIDEESNPDDVIKKLYSVKISTALLYDLTGITSIKKLFNKESDKFLIMAKPYQVNEVLLYFNYKNNDGEFYLKKLNTGMENIKNNGIYLKILEKYYGKNSVPKELLTR